MSLQIAPIAWILSVYTVEDQPRAMDDRDGWGERIIEIRASNYITLFLGGGSHQL